MRLSFLPVLGGSKRELESEHGHRVHQVSDRWDAAVQLSVLCCTPLFCLGFAADCRGVARPHEGVSKCWRPHMFM